MLPFLGVIKHHNMEKTMRYKDIARQIIVSRGIHQEPTAEDGKRYNPSERNFTDKQLGKIQEAFDASVEWLQKKWKLNEE